MNAKKKHECYEKSDMNAKKTWTLRTSKLVNAKNNH